MKIALVGGGSGGHITPLLAVAHELKRLQPDVHLIYIGEKGGKFADVIVKSPLIDEAFAISAGKFRRYPGNKLQRALDMPTNVKNARDAVRFLRGSFEARQLLKQLKVDGIFIKGGFVGVPVGKAAARLGIPYVTHDSDSTPGLANRLIAKSAAVNATGMPAEFYSYPKEKVAFVGNPVADEFKPITPPARRKFREELGIGRDVPVVAVTGGSQGASSLNDAFLKIIPDLFKAYPQLVVLHIAGPDNQEAIDKRYTAILPTSMHDSAIVKGYVTDIYRYTGAADVVLTRAGASAITELAAQRQAAIVVPGLLADDHQTKNALQLQSHDAVVVIEEKTLKQDPAVLLTHLSDLLKDSGRRTMLGRNLARLTKPDAAAELAALLLDTFRKRG